MNIAKVLHDKAMELSDEAMLARMEGKNEAAQTFLKQAFALEKTAAIDYAEAIENNIIRYYYLRGAATLAYQCGNFVEAAQLVQSGLMGAPPDFIRTQLEELGKQIQENRNQELEYKKETTMHLKGVLTEAYGTENKIKIQENADNYLMIFVPKNLIDKIVIAYWRKMVEIEASPDPTGIIILKKIKLAA